MGTRRFFGLFRLGVLVALFSASEGRAVTLRPADLVVADPSAQLVLRVDPLTGNQTTISSGGSLVDIEVEADGNLVAVDSGGVSRIDPITGSQVSLSSGGNLTNPMAIAVEASGALLVAEPGSGGTIVRIDPVSGAQTVLASGGLLGNPQDLSLEASGDALVIDSGANAVLRVDASTGGVTTVSSGGFENPSGIAVEVSGDAVVSDTGAMELVRVDTSTGLQSVLSSGGLFSNPRQLAVEATGDLVVADDSENRIIRVNATDGTQTTVSFGASFQNPRSVTVVPLSLLVVDPDDDPVAVELLGGTGVPGGFEVTCDATQGGALTADYDTQTPQERSDCVAAGDCQPVNFAVPGAETQQWQLDFAGAFQGLATLVFRYDAALLGAFPETRLAVYHFAHGLWKRLTGTLNVSDDTITVTVPEADGFSLFVIGELPACQDGEDNDGDLLVDLADGGCTDAEDRSEVPDCQDGLSNDSDGLVDYPDDPGCTSASDPRETAARACDDGIDNDGDEQVDFPADPNCASPLGELESPLVLGGGCGLGPELAPLVLALVALRRRRSGARACGR